MTLFEQMEARRKNDLAWKGKPLATAVSKRFFPASRPTADQAIEAPRELHGGQNYIVSRSTMSAQMDKPARADHSTHDPMIARTVQRSIALLPSDENVQPNDHSKRAMAADSMRDIRARQVARIERQRELRRKHYAEKAAIEERARQLLNQSSAVTRTYQDGKRASYIKPVTEVSTQTIHTVRSAVYTAAMEAKIPEHTTVSKDKADTLPVNDYGTQVTMSKRMSDVLASLATRFPRGFSAAMNKRVTILDTMSVLVTERAKELKRAKRQLELAEMYRSECNRMILVQAANGGATRVLSGNAGGDTSMAALIGLVTWRDGRTDCGTLARYQANAEFHMFLGTDSVSGIPYYIPCYAPEYGGAVKFVAATPRRMNGGIDPFTRPVKAIDHEGSYRVVEQATSINRVPRIPARHELMTALEGALHSASMALSNRLDFERCGIAV